MFYDNPPAIVITEDLRQFEVSFILKPKNIRTTEIVSARSTQNAREIIYARYGKSKVTNVKVTEVKKKD